MSPYWELVRWAALVASIGASIRYLPKALVFLVAAFTSNTSRSRQCLEALRLTRRDAPYIPSYLPPSGGSTSSGLVTPPRQPSHDSVPADPARLGAVSSRRRRHPSRQRPR